MNSIADRTRILHLGSDPSESALLDAELDAESIPCRVTHVSSEQGLRAVLEGDGVDLVIADLPLPFESAASRLAELQSLRPELQVIFRPGSIGNRTVADSVMPTARAVRDALRRRGEGGQAPEASRDLIDRVVRNHAAQLRLQRRDLWDFDEAVRDITRIAAELLDVDRVSLWEVDPATSKLHCILVFDRERNGHTAVTELELGPRYLAALEAATFIAADDAQHDPRTSEFTADYLSKLGISSMLDAPVRRDGRIVGVICHEHAGPIRHWSILDQCAAAGIADIVARALEVRDRRRAETRLRESEKFEVIGRLAGRLAHDFNNLLTVILGNAQLALQRHLDEPAEREGLEQILQAGEDATGLIRQLLAYSRHEVVSPRTVDLHAEVSAMVPMVQRLLGADVNVRTEFEDGPLWVEIDPTQFQQVLLNLTANARDAMAQGGELMLTLRRDTARAESARGAARSRIRLRVRDTGVGISPETLPHIFEPFFTTKEARVGTGLGLASVSEIVRRAGGEVLVTSRLGAGSTFDILLPELSASELEKRAIDESQLSPPASARHAAGTALIVASDPSLRGALVTQISREGIGVLEAGGPVEALEWLARGSRFDSVVTDYVLPKMDGVRLIRHLRDFKPNLPALLIADPGRCNPAELQSLRKSGATELVAKPLNPVEFQASLDRLQPQR